MNTHQRIKDSNGKYRVIGEDDNFKSKDELAEYDAMEDD